MHVVFCSLVPRPSPSFPSLAESWLGPRNEASPTLPYCKRREAGRGPGNKATFFECKGYRVVLDSAVLSITGMTFLTRPNFIPSPPRYTRAEAWERDQLAAVGFCSPVVFAHGGVGGETCRKVLVTSADVKSRPEGLQITFFDPFPNLFCVLVLPVLDVSSH